MACFAGMDDDTGRDIGPLETTVKRFVDDYGQAHGPVDSYRLIVMEGMTSLARNIDSQTRKGREISRNMSALLDCVRELRQMDAEAGTGGEDDTAVNELMEAMRL